MEGRQGDCNGDQKCIFAHEQDSHTSRAVDQPGLLFVLASFGFSQPGAWLRLRRATRRAESSTMPEVETDRSIWCGRVG